MTTLIGFAFMILTALVGLTIGFFDSANPVVTGPLTILFFAAAFWLGTVLNEGKHKHRAMQVMSLLETEEPRSAAPFESPKDPTHGSDPLLDLLNRPAASKPSPYSDPRQFGDL